MKFLSKYLMCLLLVGNTALLAQNENAKWYFGNLAGLDFMTTSPTALTNGVLSTSEGCATIADNAGNLLFYTDGSTVWNRLHVVMANGTGLLGNSSTTQSGVIVKQPGNPNIYYVFSLGAGGAASLYYSIVDMSLAAGNGSVVTKNTLIYGPCSEKLTSVKHCNGTDVWIIYHESGSSTNYRANLVTASGLNTSPVISPGVIVGTAHSLGYLKISPNGKKAAAGAFNVSGSVTQVEVSDFDASTGVLSNPSILYAPGGGAYGCEFSPDGTKVYATSYNTRTLYQWDLCAGSTSAILSSSIAISTSTAGFAALQLATNGKIYLARSGQQWLGVINNPNSSGLACNYVDLGQSIAPRTSFLGLPNFITSGFKPPPPPFSYTVSNSYGCQTATFVAPAVVQNFTMNNCVASGYSLTGLMWNFGDPNSGVSNTSTLTNPSHAFSSLGTYTAQLILYYSCGGGSDTIKGVINVNQPCISVSPGSITCSSLGSATVTAFGGIGPYSFTWQPGGQTNSVATGLAPGTYTLSVFDFGNNFTYTASSVISSSVPLTGTLNNSSSVPCNGVSSGTAAYTNLAGGSAVQNYTWSNGSSTFTANTPTIGGLGAGSWSVLVKDALTGCTLSNVFSITQPPALTLNVSAASPSACAGTSVVLSGTNSGGTPGTGVSPAYVYSWSAGPSTSTYNASQNVAGNYVYTLTSSDFLSCSATNTIGLNFVANPVLTVSSVSVCPNQTGTLTVSGASSYTWTGGSSGSFFTASPTVSTQYSVIGTSSGCSTTATAAIVLKAVPSIVLSSNSSICQGQSLVFSAQGGTAFAWTGVNAFASSSAGNTISAASPIHSGNYSVVVTAANNCTNVASFSLTVNPTPTVSASGATVCAGQALAVSASAPAGSSFSWSGPSAFVAASQNPTITSHVNFTGAYTVAVSSANNCSNSAIAHVSVTAPPVSNPLCSGAVCAGQPVSLSGSGSTGAQNYTWNGPNGFNSAIANPSIAAASAAAGGQYTLTVIAGPCLISAVTNVTVYALPTPTVSGSSSVCQFKTLSLQALAPPTSTLTNYSWAGPSAFIASGPSVSRDSCAMNCSGFYTVTVTDVHGCVGSASASFSVIPNPTLTTTSATVCLHEPAVLSADGANTYLWSKQGVTLFSVRQATIAAANNPVGNPEEWLVIGTAVNGCTANASAWVNTLPLPTPIAAVEPAARVCMGDMVVFKGSGALAYDWKGPGNYRFSGASAWLTADNLQLAGTYSLTAFDRNGCRGTAKVNLGIDPLPQGYLSASKLQGCVPLCANFNFVPLAEGSPSVISQSWRIDKTPVIMDQPDRFAKCFNSPGNYLISGLINAANGCVNTLTYVVNAYPQPVADFTFSPQYPIENTEPVTFINTSAGKGLKTFSWFFIDNTGFTDNQRNTSYLFADAGNYAVAMKVEDENGCSDTIVKNITINPDFVFYVPNAFTPNGDDHNEVFIPVSRGVKFYEFHVFNRWGQRIFATTSALSGWDGSFNGKACPQDTYVWKAVVSTTNGEMKEFTGTVTLFR